MKAQLRLLWSGFKQQPRWVRFSSYLLVVYLCYALLLGVIAPLILQAKVPAALSELLGRQVTVTKITINPFLLRARVNGFSIKEASSSADFVRFDQLEVDVGFWSTLLHFTPTLEHISLSSPYAQLARESVTDTEMRFNFSDLLETLASDSASSAEPVPDEKASIPHLRIQAFSMLKGHAVFSDQVTDALLDYPDLNFHITHLDTQAMLPVESNNDQALTVSDNSYNINIETAEKGRLNLRGQFQLQPLMVTGSIQLDSIALAPLWPLTGDIIPAKLTGGTLDFFTRYSLEQTPDSLQFSTQEGALAFNSLAVNDAIKERVKVGKLAVKDIALNSLAQQVSINAITLDDLWVDAYLQDETVNLATLFTPPSQAQSNSSPAKPTTSEPQANEADAPAWLVSLASFTMSNGDIQFTDHDFGQGVQWRVFPLTLTALNANSALSEPIDYSVNLALSTRFNDTHIEQGGQLSLTGQYNGNVQQAKGAVNLSDLQLGQFQSYLDKYINISLTSGALSVDGEYDAVVGGNTQFAGNAEVAELVVLDNVHHEPLAKWQNLAITGVEYVQNQPSLKVDNVVFTQPYAKVQIAEDKQTNIGNLLKTADTHEQNEEAALPVTSVPTSAPEDKPAEPMQIVIKQITIDDGAAYFADYSLTPDFATSIESFNGTISQLSSQADTTAAVDLAGSIDNYAPVTLKGEVNPLLDAPFLDLALSVKSAELTSVNPYSGTYMGYYIDKGQLSIDVDYKLQNNQLQGDNHVVIDQLTLGKKSDSEQAMNLPLGLAIALLQDSDGVIDLGMEVSGDLDSPSFSIGGIILKALGNIITKAVTAPFTLLASLVDSDEELDKVMFAAGSATLTEQAQGKLASLSEALKKRPKLVVNIEGVIEQVADSRALAEQALLSKLQQRSGLASLPENLSPSRIPQVGPIPEALASLFVEETGGDVAQEKAIIVAGLNAKREEQAPLPTEEAINTKLNIALYNKLLNAQTISQPELGGLAAERAKAVKSWLAEQGEIAGGRLFLLNSTIDFETGQSAVHLTVEAK